MQELLLLQRVNDAVNTGAPLDAVLATVTQGVVEDFRYAACDVYWYDRGADELELLTIAVESAALRRAEALTGLTARGLRVELAQGGELSRVVHEKATLLSTDMVRVFEDFTSNPVLKRLAGQVARIFGFAAALRAPLVVREEVIGVIGVARREPITEQDRARLARFAAHVSLAIAKARAEEELQRAHAGLERKVEERTAELERANRELQGEIAAREARDRERMQLIRELHQALAEVRILSGMLPICASCKKIRDDTGYWNQIENYISDHSSAVFSHGICPDCARKLYPGLGE